MIATKVSFDSLSGVGQGLTGMSLLGSGGRGAPRRWVARSPLDLASLNPVVIPIDPPRPGQAL